MPDASSSTAPPESGRRASITDDGFPYVFTVAAGHDPEDGSETCHITVFGVPAGRSLDAATAARRLVRASGESRPLTIEVIAESHAD